MKSWWSGSEPSTWETLQCKVLGSCPKVQQYSVPGLSDMQSSGFLVPLGIAVCALVAVPSFFYFVLPKITQYYLERRSPPGPEHAKEVIQEDNAGLSAEADPQDCCVGPRDLSRVGVRVFPPEVYNRSTEVHFELHKGDGENDDGV